MNVEAEYRALIAAMSPAERMSRSEELFRWSREFIVREILAEKGPMSDRALRLEVADRVYGSDPRMRALIDELRDRDTD